MAKGWPLECLYRSKENKQAGGGSGAAPASTPAVGHGPPPGPHEAGPTTGLWIQLISQGRLYTINRFTAEMLIYCTASLSILIPL